MDPDLTLRQTLEVSVQMLLHMKLLTLDEGFSLIFELNQVKDSDLWNIYETALADFDDKLRVKILGLKPATS